MIWVYVHTVSSANPDRDLIGTLEERAIAFEKAAETLRAAVAVLRGGAQVSARLYAKRKQAGKQEGSLPKAVLDFFHAHPGKKYNAKEILAGVEEMGYERLDGKDPLNHLRNVVTRLAQLGDLTRVQKGYYMLPAEDDGPEATVTHLLREGLGGS